MIDDRRPGGRRTPLRRPLHRRSPTGPAPSTSRSCGARSTPCSTRSGLAPDSHDGRELWNILETYPRDELFQIDVDELFDDRHRHPRTCRSASRCACSPGGTTTAASSPAWCTCRGTATDGRGRRADRSRCCCRPSAGRGSEHDVAHLRERAGPRCTSSSTLGPTSAGPRRPRRGGDAAWPASVAGGSTTCATRSSWRSSARTTGLAAAGPLRRGLPGAPTASRTRPQAAVVPTSAGWWRSDDEGFITALLPAARGGAEELRLKLYTAGQPCRCPRCCPCSSTSACRSSTSVPTRCGSPTAATVGSTTSGCGSRPAPGARRATRRGTSSAPPSPALWRGEIESDGLQPPRAAGRA